LTKKSEANPVPVTVNWLPMIPEVGLTAIEAGDGSMVNVASAASCGSPTASAWTSCARRATCGTLNTETNLPLPPAIAVPSATPPSETATDNDGAKPFPVTVKLEPTGPESGSSAMVGGGG